MKQMKQLTIFYLILILTPLCSSCNTEPINQPAEALPATPLVVLATASPTNIPPSVTQVSQPAGTPTPAAGGRVMLLKPRDAIGKMTINTGAKFSAFPPVWAFCSPAFKDPSITEVSCELPYLPELAIGHGWFSADETLRNDSWMAMGWELYLDGQQVKLNSFGAYDVDLPQKGLPGMDPDEEVITKLRSWDVLLRNPAPGLHVLRSVLYLNRDVDDGFHITQAGTYELVVNFRIAEPPPTQPPQPTEVGTLVSSPDLIIGTWVGMELHGLIQRFNPDGTLYVWSLITNPSGPPDAILSYRFDGTLMAIQEVNADGMEAIGMGSCGTTITGTYEVYLLGNGNIRLEVITDTCEPRRSSTSQLHTPYQP